MDVEASAEVSGAVTGAARLCAAGIASQRLLTNPLGAMFLQTANTAELTWICC